MIKGDVRGSAKGSSGNEKKCGEGNEGMKSRRNIWK